METFVFGFGGLPLDRSDKPVSVYCGGWNRLCLWFWRFTARQIRQTRVSILWRMESFVFVVLAALLMDRSDKPVSVYCGGWNRLCLWFCRLYRWTDQTNPCLYTVADGIVCVCGFGGLPLDRADKSVSVYCGGAESHVLGM